MGFPCSDGQCSLSDTAGSGSSAGIFVVTASPPSPGQEPLSQRGYDGACSFKVPGGPAAAAGVSLLARACTRASLSHARSVAASVLQA